MSKFDDWRQNMSDLDTIRILLYVKKETNPRPNSDITLEDIINNLGLGEHDKDKIVHKISFLQNRRLIETRNEHFFITEKGSNLIEKLSSMP